jgi:AmmeMemoRadiSam system protein A
MVHIDLIAMSKPNINRGQQERLINLAHDSIEHGLKYGRALQIDTTDYHSELREKRATFVTLTINHQLRGCIGMLEAHRPLIEDVVHNAFAAAFSDPRFPPLTSGELSQLEIHISILNPAESLAFSSEADLINQLRPGVDGLILEDGRNRGTFLPSVWQSLPNPKDFFDQLKLKAGLPINHWSASLQVKRYTTTSFPAD